MQLPLIHYGDSLDFTAILDDMQSCTIVPFSEDDLVSLEAVRAHSGNDLSENILIQITEVGI